MTDADLEILVHLLLQDIIEEMSAKGAAEK